MQIMQWMRVLRCRASIQSLLAAMSVLSVRECAIRVMHRQTFNYCDQIEYEGTTLRAAQCSQPTRLFQLKCLHTNKTHSYPIF